MPKKAPLTVNKVPSQKQVSDWLARITEYGSVTNRDNKYNIQRHHVVGRTRRQSVGMQKFHIGQWFVIPICFELHDVHSNHPDHVDHHKKRFLAKYGRQCDLFEAMCRELEKDAPLPFDEDVMAAIMATGI